MTLDQGVVAVRAAIAGIACLLVLRFALLPARCEVFRQRVFRLRRELLMLRIDGLVDPDEPAYVALYRRMNALIRRADSLTFGRLLMVVLVPVPPAVRAQGLDEVETLLANAPPAARAALDGLRLDVGYEVVRHVLVTSPLAWLAALVVLPGSVLMRTVSATGAGVVGAFRSSVRGSMRTLGQRPAVKRFETEATALLPDELPLAA